MNGVPEHVALRAFVQVYADTAHLMGEYRRDITAIRTGAGDVAAAVMQIEKAQLFRMISDLTDPPRVLSERDEWVAAGVAMMWGAVRWAVPS